MKFNPQHFGLYFNAHHATMVQQQSKKNTVLGWAVQWLDASAGDLIREAPSIDYVEEATTSINKVPLTQLEAALSDAYRYRFLDDNAAGQSAANILSTLLQDHETLLKILLETTTAAQLYEMVRPLVPSTWMNQFADYARTLLAAHPSTIYEQLWQITLGIAAAIVLEDPALMEESTAAFRHQIDTLIHPEGYLPAVVEDAEKDTYLLTVQALIPLTLAAEAATQAGVDLWAYEKRGVGIGTAAAYLVYYYYYPEKWRWQDNLSVEKTAAILRKHGAFMEIVTYRQKPRGVEVLLDHHRPFFSVYGGGLTTLTHGMDQKKKRRWFGR